MPIEFIPLVMNNRKDKHGNQRPIKYREDGWPEEVDEVWGFGIVRTIIANPKDEEEMEVSKLFHNVLSLPAPREYSRIRDKISMALRARRAQLPREQQESYCEVCGMPLGALGVHKATRIKEGKIVERLEHTKNHQACTAESAQRNYNRDKRTARRKKPKESDS
jgi:hypothetical protein